MYHPICRKMLASDLGIDLANLQAPAAKKAQPVKSCCGCGKQNSETNYFPILAAVLGGAAIVAFSLMKKR
jgi:hypothetical protein